MPKQILRTEFDAILFALSGFPEGASIENILSRLELKLPHRTLQRRLAILVRNKRLLMIGRGRGIHYKLFPRYVFPSIIPSMEIAHSSRNFSIAEKMETSYEIYIPISSAGEEIKKIVQGPVEARRATTYRRDLLDSYEPNVTYYLSQEIRDSLYAKGTSLQMERPAGTYARKILNRFLIDLSWNSSRLEGNSYSLLETERLLELAEISEGKNIRDAKMILNHKRAIEFLVDFAEDIQFNSYTIFNLHALLADSLLEDDFSCGRLRTISVGIHKSAYTPSAIPQLIEECFHKILNLAEAIHDPFEQAFFIMVHLPYLQPFEDVNKRVSRLAINIPFIRKNLSPVSFVKVPERAYIDGILGVYELNRIELLRDIFIWAYEKSAGHYAEVCQTLGQPDLFKVRYCNLISNVITEVILRRLNKRETVLFVRESAEKAVLLPDRSKFIEAVETGLRSLHSGNFARYRVRPAEFEAWLVGWKW